MSHCQLHLQYNCHRFVSVVWQREIHSHASARVKRQSYSLEGMHPFQLLVIKIFRFQLVGQSKNGEENEQMVNEVTMTDNARPVHNYIYTVYNHLQGCEKQKQKYTEYI